MGRSLTPIDSAPSVVLSEDGTHDLFEAQGFVYRSAPGWSHFSSADARNRQGRMVAQVEREVSFVLGSGGRGISFLVDSDGHLSSRRSPGMPSIAVGTFRPAMKTSPTASSDRSILNACSATPTRWSTCPALRAAISRRSSGATPSAASGAMDRASDTSLSRYRRAAASLPLSTPTTSSHRCADVCQQCHLIGKEHVDPVDHGLFDYPARASPPPIRHRLRPAAGTERPLQRRPGRADVPEPLLPRQQRPARMHFLPRSAQAAPSRGEGGLLSGPLPGMPRRSGLYLVPPAYRRAQTPTDDCIECHMPRAPVTDISHTSLTIHSIPRHREDGLSSSADNRAPLHTLVTCPLPPRPHEPRRTSGRPRRDWGVVLGEMKGGSGAARSAAALGEGAGGSAG